MGRGQYLPRREHIMAGNIVITAHDIMTDAEYIVHGLECITRKPKTIVAHSLAEALGTLDGWVGWYNHYNEGYCRGFDDSDKDFWLEKA